MTTTANKQGLRAAGVARTAKAAQRTALPPKAGAVQDAKDAIDLAKDILDVLQAPAKKARPSRKAAAEAKAEQEKADFAREVEKAEKVEAKVRSNGRKPKAEPVVEAPVEAPVAPEKPKKGKKAPEVTPATAEAPAASKGRAKAEKAAALFTANGWECTIQEDGDWTELVAVRATETQHHGWVNGVWDPQRAGTYHNGDRTVRTRNIAEGLRWAVRTKQEADAQFAKVVTNKAFRKSVPAPVLAKGFPFDPELASDAEILAALQGQKVVWVNRISGEEDKAVVGAAGPFTRMTWTPETDAAPAERVVLTCDRENGGFRAFRVADIRQIGRTRVQA